MTGEATGEPSYTRTSDTENTLKDYRRHGRTNKRAGEQTYFEVALTECVELAPSARPFSVQQTLCGFKILKPSSPGRPSPPARPGSRSRCDAVHGFSRYLVDLQETVQIRTNSPKIRLVCHRLPRVFLRSILFSTVFVFLLRTQTNVILPRHIRKALLKQQSARVH